MKMIGILIFLCLQTYFEIMHHDIPMELDNSLQGSATLHGIDIQDPRLGDENRSSILGDSRVELRILIEKETGFTSQGIQGIGVEILGLGLGTGFGGLFDHGDAIVIDKLARPEPSAESPDFTLILSKRIDRIFKVSTTLFDFVPELELKL
jgi:hypothetical protein